MRDPRTPDTQPDEYLPDLPDAHQQRAGASKADAEGVNPRDTSSMPRGEDDAETWADSPEYHDRTDMRDAGTATPPPDSVHRVPED
jgi:hypothetical protein